MDERALRIDLAAAFRLSARFNLHEGIANHYSADCGDGHFLMNPRGRHFSRIRAGDLLKLNSADKHPPTGDSAPDPTAWCLHGFLHRELPRARVILHTHMPYATALASLKDYRLQMADQNACRFFGEIGYDDAFGGMLLADSESQRLLDSLGDKSVLFMRGHGIMLIAPTIAQAFDELYYLERASMNQVLAMSTGLPLNEIPDDVAQTTRNQWRNYGDDFCVNHFSELKKILDEEEPEYKDANSSRQKPFGD